MIHTSYTVGITTAEFLALQNVMTEQDTWIENCIQNRARLSIENITSKYNTYQTHVSRHRTRAGSFFFSHGRTHSI